MSNKKATQPYWRPDFKIQSSLPDIKVVRTDFIINFVVVALMLVVLFTLLQREYRAYTLGSSIRDLEARIASSEARDNRSLKESERFRSAAQSVIDLQRFYRTPYSAHDVLAELSKLKPEGLMFSNVTVSERVIAAKKTKAKGNKKAKSTPAMMTYSININGDVEQLMILTEFKNTLRASELFAIEGFSLEVDESMQQRNATTGVTPFQVSISLTPSATAAKGGQG